MNTVRFATIIFLCVVYGTASYADAILDSAAFAVAPSALDESGTSFSDVILESATLGSPFQSNGPTLASFQYVGARFHVTKPTRIDHIGGFLGAAVPGESATVFGAIAELDSPNGFPTVRPSDFQPLAVITFEVFQVKQDTLAPLDVLLIPGHYALIFGGGRFGAVGRGTIPRGNHDTLQASYFQGSFPSTTENLWRNDGGLVNMRFLITGTEIPEPEALTLAIFAAVSLVWLMRR